MASFWPLLLLVGKAIAQLVDENEWILSGSLDRGAASSRYVEDDSLAKWCTVTDSEQDKCEDLAYAMQRHNRRTGSTFFTMRLECVQANGRDKCMELIREQDADLIALDAGLVYAAGRHYSLVPIVREQSGDATTNDAVVIVKKGVGIRRAEDLRDRRVCSPDVGSMAGWILPLEKLLKIDREGGESVIPILDCNNHLRSAASFFGPSCVPNALHAQYNLNGDNPSRLCDQCGVHGGHPTWCTTADPYGRLIGVLRCLNEGGGEVGFIDRSFLKRRAVHELAGDSFELLCPDGSAADQLGDAEPCTWGRFPNNAVVTVSSKTYRMRVLYQSLLQNITEAFGQTGLGPRASYSVFDSIDYEEEANLLFSDGTTSLVPVPESEQSYRWFLGSEYESLVQGLQACHYAVARLCVVSKAEEAKCRAVSTAFASKGLKPRLSCAGASSHRECMARIDRNEADLTMLDAADLYFAERTYGLTPIMAEVYDLDEPIAYAVAVAKIKDPDTTLLDLRGKRSCHGAINSAAGWAVPVGFLMSQNRLRPAWDCEELIQNVASIFSKSCAPGALWKAFDENLRNPENLCDLCVGQSQHYCSRTPNEPYYGDSGAFKCLAEGGGHVAFVQHTAVWANTDGRNQAFWARALVSADYELLCPDGTRRPATDYVQCHLARVPADAMATSSRRPEAEIDAYTNLFFYGQTFYGSKSGYNLKLFASAGSEAGAGVAADSARDLIFKDSTRQLVPLDRQQRRQYLDRNFVANLVRAQCASADRVSSVGFLALVAISVHCFYSLL